MSALDDALVWLNDPLNWQGRNGVPYLTYEHLYISGLAVALAAVVALPTALLLGHTGRGGALTVLVTNVSRAIPTLALLTVFAATAIGFGNRATILALAVFAAPPLLTNTYIGMRGVDPDIVEAARGMGMSERSLLVRVELPLALPLIAAGFRTAAVQVVATATLAALVGGGGLGTIINSGFGRQDQGQILAGGVLVALLALGTEGALALLQRSVTPGRVRRWHRLTDVKPRETADAVSLS
ncbi:MAG: osmoprotectant transport system permease protein [Actinomycetota bacterium]|jgi:osmoprotectant transport system permease protein|nr:osmoprotectant transport system permease protein [Actinomycetota bacterium]MDQ1669656.1 osmoprotectant transport system permease protein [Actinomycetota bacterium]